MSISLASSMLIPAANSGCSVKTTSSTQAPIRGCWVNAPTERTSNTATKLTTVSSFLISVSLPP